MRPLINPRQSAPIVYAGSPLNLPGQDEPWANTLAAPGAPAPEALLDDGTHLSRHFGAGFICLVFARTNMVHGGEQLHRRGITQLAVPASCTQAWQRYGLGQGVDEALVLVRPDAYVMGRWSGLDASAVAAAFDLSGVLT